MLFIYLVTATVFGVLTYFTHGISYMQRTGRVGTPIIASAFAGLIWPITMATMAISLLMMLLFIPIKALDDMFGGGPKKGEY